jgi:hypothetical protein
MSLLYLPRQIRLDIHVICGIKLWLELGTNLHVIVEDSYMVMDIPKHM